MPFWDGNQLSSTAAPKLVMNGGKLVSARFPRQTERGSTSVPFIAVAFAPSKVSGIRKCQATAWRGSKAGVHSLVWTVSCGLG